MRESRVVLEWIKEGKMEGKAEGKAEGQLEATRANLFQVTQARFHTPLPADVTAAMEAITDPTELSRWLVAAATAASLDAFRQAVGLDGSTARR